jgi:hypothetical protein
MHALELTRSDTYSREEGHDTPATLSMSMRLSLRLKDLRDQATGESASAATRQTGCGCFRMRALALRASTWQTRRGNAGSGALSPNSDSPGPTLVKGAEADQGDAFACKIQEPRKPRAGVGADERRPCSHTRRTQSQSAGVINAVHGTAWHQS